MKLNLQKKINEAKFTELGSSVISLLVFIPCVFLLDQSDHSSILWGCENTEFTQHLFPTMQTRKAMDKK